MSSLGLFTAAQARAVGVSGAVIGYHNRAGGRWTRVLPGVYELAGLEPDPRRRLLAALLWAGDDGVLSHQASSWLFSLDGIRSPTPELWVPRGPGPKGLVVHRGVVPADERARTGFLRHTKLVRTVLDLGTTMDDDMVEIVLESALRRYPSAADALMAAAADSRKGARRLRRVFARRPPGAPPTESELETRYLQVVRKAGLPTPVRQRPVLDRDGICLGRMDVSWPEARLWVELDSREWHDRPSALFRDRRRQNEIAAWLRYTPLRFTWPDVVRTPSHTARLTWDAYLRGRGSEPATALPLEITSM